MRSTLMAHFEHGAIDKTTTYLVDPVSALRRTIYECPDCKRDVFVKKGKIKIPHFAHRKDKDNPCTYFNRNPTLDQQHKNAQLKLKQFLERGKEIDIGRRCACGCGWISNWGITVLKHNIVKTEHKFKFNDSNKSADIAVLKSDKSIICIFEIVHKHYTREIDRPEPWHEIRAQEINAIPSDIDRVVITCVREKIRHECIERQRVENEERLKRMSQREKEQRENDARFQEWVKKEDERIRIRLEKEAELQKQLNEKIKKENEEERKKWEEIQKQVEEERNKWEEQRKKQIELERKEYEEEYYKTLEERNRQAEIQKQIEEQIKQEKENEIKRQHQKRKFK
jgi:hypothetical protein